MGVPTCTSHLESIPCPSPTIENTEHSLATTQKNKKRKLKRKKKHERHQNTSVIHQNKEN